MEEDAGDHYNHFFYKSPLKMPVRIKYPSSILKTPNRKRLFSDITPTPSNTHSKRNTSSTFFQSDSCSSNNLMRPTPKSMFQNKSKGIQTTTISKNTISSNNLSNKTNLQTPRFNFSSLKKGNEGLTISVDNPSSSYNTYRTHVTKSENINDNKTKFRIYKIDPNKVFDLPPTSRRTITEEQEEAKRCISEIKKLNFWDVQNITSKEIKELPITTKARMKERETINWANHIKADLNKLKMDKMNPHIKNFHNKSEMEYKCMLLHNINISKKKINFDIFKKIKLNEKGTKQSRKNQSISGDKSRENSVNKGNAAYIGNGSNSSISIPKKFKLVNSKSKKTISQLELDVNNIHNLTDSQKFTHNLKYDENFDKLSNIDYYRSIIKSKIKNERGFRKEIMDSCQAYYERKIEKTKLEKRKVDILNRLNLLKNEITSKETMIENEKREIQKKFEKMLNRGPFDENQTSISNHNNSNNLGNVNSSAILNTNQNMNVSLSQSHLSHQTNNKVHHRKNHSKFVAQSDQFFKMNADSQKIINKIGDEFDYLTSKFKILKEESDKKLEKINKTIDILENEIKIYKNNINCLIKDQRIYYEEILKKGIDVRRTGLTWVIQRLIELNTEFQPDMFPRFLDTYSVEYLLQYSYKSIENNQLKTILHTLKNRQKKIREDNLDILMSTSKTNFNKTGFDFMLQNHSGKHNLSFSNKIVNLFENIFKKYENITKSAYEHRIEDANLHKVVDELKTKIKYTNINTDDEFINYNTEEYGSENEIEDETFYNTNGFFKYFKENKKHKEFFDEIMLLRQAISKNEEELEKIKNEEMMNYKKKYETHKNSKNNIEYEITFAALFGNGIIA